MTIKPAEVNLKFATLSWKLLEAKITYYLYPETNTLEDSEYDSLERLYLSMCSEYDFPNTIQSMVGVDETRPSVQNAIQKILSRT